MSDHEPLSKWNSCKDNLHLPETPRSGITKLHIYDFDNTLYCSPHPTRQLYTDVLYNTLYNSSTLIDGGWWSEPSFLEQSFKNMLNADEQDQLQYWNQQIVNLAEASSRDAETISIVLTGRKEALFQEIFDQMFSTFGKISMNAICLKRTNVASSTAEYKIKLITEFLHHYSCLKELIIYDDRLAQVKQFQRAFENGRVIHVQPRFRTLEMDEEARLVGAIFERSNMTKHLAWTAKAPGFILERSSYKKLLGWTHRFFKKKYKMSLLPQWPMIIPLAVRSDLEIAKIWSNNDPDIVKSLGKAREIRDMFYSQSNLYGSKVFQFDIVKIGYSLPCKGRAKISVFYKAIPSDSTRYVSASAQNMFFIGTNEDVDRDPSRTAGVRWATLDRSIGVKTTLGHSERLTYV